MLRLRGESYLAELGGLTDERWLYAVSVAMRKRWFPSIEELLEYAAEAPQPATRAALPEEASLTSDEADAAAARGLDLIARALRAKGIEVRPVVHDMPEPEDQRERLETLRQQANTIAPQGAGR